MDVLRPPAPGSIAEMLSRAWPPPAPKYDGRELASGLNVTGEDGAALVRHFDTATASLSPDARFGLFRAVEAITRAERVRIAGRKARQRDKKYSHLDKLTRAAVDAARLSHYLHGSFSPFGAIRSLTIELAQFSAAAFRVRSLSDFIVDSRVASAVLKELRPQIQEVPKAIIAGLVSVALGDNAFDESALRRRYLQTKNPLLIGPPWLKDWQSITELLLRLAPETSSSWGEVYADWVAPDSFAGRVQDSINAITEIALTKAADKAKRPARRERMDEIRRAQTLRATLTRTLQAARNDGGTAYGSAIRDALEENLSGEQRELIERQLTADLEKGGTLKLKPSTVATRICVLRFNLPLRLVRAGRSAAPRVRSRLQAVRFTNRLEGRLEKHRLQGKQRLQSAAPDAATADARIDKAWAQRRSRRSRRPR